MMEYVITIRKWDEYAGEGGEWMWSVLQVLEVDDKNLEMIETGLQALELKYAIGKVEDVRL